MQSQEKISINLEAGEINENWEKSRQNEVIKHLLAGEDLQIVMKLFPGFKESFCRLDTIDCSDGRVLMGKKIGIAGSGLLLPDEEKDKFVSAYRGRIKELTTHRDCGAAAKKFATLKPAEIPSGIETADQYGVWCGKQLAEQLGARHRFLDLEQMASQHHNETAIVLDQTGEFDSTNLRNFPTHFTCTGAALGFSEEYMKSELTTLIGIALGDHGFGKRFDRANPFYVIVVANNYAELIHWENVAKEVSRVGERVAVKGFVRPRED